LIFTTLLLFLPHIKMNGEISNVNFNVVVFILYTSGILIYWYLPKYGVKLSFKGPNEIDVTKSP
jgi:hypothetical protein